MNSYTSCFLILLIFSLHSCANYINLTEAQALGKGEVMMQIEAQLDVPKVLEIKETRASFEVLTKRGITNSLDLGFYMNSFGDIGLHSKYQLLDQAENDLSAGLDFKFPLTYISGIYFHPTIYYTRAVGKNKLLINPSLEIDPNYPSKSYRYTPNINIGLIISDSPIRVGYNLRSTKIVKTEFTHNFGIVFDIYRASYWQKKREAENPQVF